MTSMVQKLPKDLGRVASKGLDAMERFLDLMGEDFSEAQFARGREFARVGCIAVGASIRYLQAINNAEAIALAKTRMEKAA